MHAIPVLVVLVVAPILRWIWKARFDKYPS